MKITLNSGHGEEVTVKKAVEDKLYPAAYSYSGEFEKIEQIVEHQSELIAKLVQILCDANVVKVNQLENILGYGYKVKE